MSAQPAPNVNAGCHGPRSTGSVRAVAGRSKGPGTDDLRIPRTAFMSAWDGWLNSKGGPVKLGGETCDVVITSASVDALAAVKRMGRIQGATGVPVIVVDGAWLAWLVPPGTTGWWPPHPFALCLGGGAVFDIPARDRRAGPGPYWLRVPRTHFVHPQHLWRVLMRFQPAPSPQHALPFLLGRVQQ